MTRFPNTNAIVSNKCSATTLRGVRCSCTGKYIHIAKNYCKRHFKKVAGFEPTVTGEQIVGSAQPLNVNNKRCIFIDEDSECSICLANLLTDTDGGICITNCGHLFHHSCMKSWKEYPREGGEAGCPVCRRRTNAFRNQSDQYIVAKRIKIDTFSC